MLLSYYIASINIERVYHPVRAEQGVDEGYVEFPGMTLMDTFQLHEGDGTITEDPRAWPPTTSARRRKGLGDHNDRHESLVVAIDTR